MQIIVGLWEWQKNFQAFMNAVSKSNLVWTNMCLWKPPSYTQSLLAVWAFRKDGRQTSPAELWLVLECDTPAPYGLQSRDFRLSNVRMWLVTRREAWLLIGGGLSDLAHLPWEEPAHTPVRANKHKPIHPTALTDMNCLTLLCQQRPAGWRIRWWATRSGLKGLHSTKQEKLLGECYLDHQWPTYNTMASADCWRVHQHQINEHASPILLYLSLWITWLRTVLCQTKWILNLDFMLVWLTSCATMYESPAEAIRFYPGFVFTMMVGHASFVGWTSFPTC